MLLNYSISGFRSGKSGKVKEFARGSEKAREIRDFLEKVSEKSERKFLSMQFFNFNKKIICM